MGKKRRRFNPEFRLEAVKLVKEGGVKVSQAAQDLGVYETSLRRWIKQYEVDHGDNQSGALTTEEKEELRRLRRENRQLKMEREILKNLRARPHLLLDQKLPARLPSRRPRGVAVSLLMPSSP